MKLPIHRLVKLSYVSAAENEWLIPVSIEVTGKFPITFNEGKNCHCGSLRIRVIHNNKAMWITAQKDQRSCIKNTQQDTLLFIFLWNPVLFNVPFPWKPVFFKAWLPEWYLRGTQSKIQIFWGGVWRLSSFLFQKKLAISK